MEVGNSKVQGMSRRQFMLLGTAAAFAALGLAGCGGQASGGSAGAGAAGGSGHYQDGSYTGRSSTLDAGVDGDGYGIITITVQDDRIVDATFQAFQVDGTPKDENYGKDSDRYAVAQMIIASADDYAADLVETGTLDGVDAVSGATYLYDQFVEATQDALSQAAAQ